MYRSFKTLLPGLAITAMHSGMRRWDTVRGMLRADVVMIVTGFAFAESTLPFVRIT